MVSTLRAHSTGVESINTTSSRYPGHLAAYDRREPINALSELPATFMKSGLVGQHWEQVPQSFPGRGEEPAIRWDPHRLLGDTQRHDFRVGELTSGVRARDRQEIISCAINRDGRGCRGRRPSWPFGRRCNRYRRLRPLCPETPNHGPSRGINHLVVGRQHVVPLEGFQPVGWGLTVEGSVGSLVIVEP